MDRVHPSAIALTLLLLLSVSVGLTFASPNAANIVFAPTPPCADTQLFLQLGESFAAAPISGPQSVAVILVQFPDKANNASREEINEIAFTKLNEYWQEVSYGKISITGTITSKWYKISQSYKYFGADPETSDKRMELINKAVKLADPEINYKNYRYIIVVHAGDDQARSLKAEDMWSYASIGKGTLYTDDGTVAVGIACVAERDPVGTYAHEFGHMLGLPDLYDYSIAGKIPYTGDPFVAEWDLMAHGNWANNGETPVHLSSWSKIKLGWIADSQIQTVQPNTDAAATISPLEKASGNIYTAKIPLTDSTYYLVEVRKCVDFDFYLPSEGVLIYQVDERKGNGQGPVRVVRANPDSINEAAWQVGGVFEDNASNVRIVVMQALPDGSFNVAFGYSAQPPATTFTLTVNTSYSNIEVKLDGATYHTDQNGVAVIQNITAGDHMVEVQSTVPLGQGTQAIFTQWMDETTANPRTVSISDNLALTAKYKIQYYLTVNSAYDSPIGAGWYDANATAAFSINNSTVDYGNGTRQIFSGWNGDYSGSEPSGSIVMDAPKTVTAQWRKQYLLTVNSQYGSPQGAGWYDEGSEAVVTVTSPWKIDNETRYVLAGWMGNASSSLENTVKVMMDAPKTVTANWRAQYSTDIVFTDADGKKLLELPSPVKLAAPNGTVVALKTATGLWLDEGNWTLKQAVWHGVDVKQKEDAYIPQPKGVWKIQLNVYALTVKVVGAITGWPVKNEAEVSLELRDGETRTFKTDEKGEVNFTQLPKYSNYVVTAKAQGFTAKSEVNLEKNLTAIVKIWLWTEITMFIIIPIVVAVFATLLILKKRMKPSGKKLPKPSQAPPPPSTKITSQAEREGSSLETWFRQR